MYLSGGDGRDLRTNFGRVVRAAAITLVAAASVLIPVWLLGVRPSASEPSTAQAASDSTLAAVHAPAPPNVGRPVAKRTKLVAAPRSELHARTYARSHRTHHVVATAHARPARALVHPRHIPVHHVTVAGTARTPRASAPPPPTTTTSAPAPHQQPTVKAAAIVVKKPNAKDDKSAPKSRETTPAPAPPPTTAPKSPATPPADDGKKGNDQENGAANGDGNGNGPKAKAAAESGNGGGNGNEGNGGGNGKEKDKKK